MKRLVDLATESVAQEVFNEQERAKAITLRHELAERAELVDLTERMNYHLDRLLCLDDDVWEPNFTVVGDLNRSGRWGKTLHSNRNRGYLITDGQIKLIADEWTGRDDIEGFTFHYAWHWGNSDCDAGPCGWGTIGDPITDLQDLGRAITGHGPQKV